MKKFAGALFLTGAFTLAGTSVIAARFVSGILGTFTITTVSLFLGLLGLMPFCGRKLRKTIRQMSMRDWTRTLLQALFGIFLFRMFLLQGLMHTSAGEAGILTGAVPAVTALLAWLFLKEPLNKARFLGIVSTVTGILILQGVLSPEVKFAGEHLIGNSLVLCAAICESLFNILSRISSIKVSLSQSQDPIAQTTLVVWMALLLCLGPALVEHPAASLLSLGIVEWLALVWYGLFVTALAFIFWYSGIKLCDASTAAAFSGLMPLTSLILSALLLNEQPGWRQWFGGLMVVMGMLLTGLNLTNQQQGE